VAGRFPVYTDADIRGPVIKAPKKAGWDIVRAIDGLREGANDLPHVERAVALGRVLVTNDEDHKVTADPWYWQRRPFPGVLAWRQRTYGRMTATGIVQAFEEIAAQEDPFSPYPIVGIKPKG
jgi:hypothetical protein